MVIEILPDWDQITKLNWELVKRLMETSAEVSAITTAITQKFTPTEISSLLSEIGGMKAFIDTNTNNVTKLLGFIRQLQSLINDIDTSELPGLQPGAGIESEELHGEQPLFHFHHILSGNGPNILLEQDASAGETPQEWKISGDEVGLWVYDITSSTIPIKIQKGAPTNAFYVNSSGQYGLGTDSPSYPIHQVTDGANAGMYFHRLDSGTIFKLNITSALAQIGSVSNHKVNFIVYNAAKMTLNQSGYMGIGNTNPTHTLQLDFTGVDTKIYLNRTDGVTGAVISGSNYFDMGSISDHSTRIMVYNSWRMQLDNDDSLTMSNGATCSTIGEWTDASSRELKTDIRKLSVREANKILAGLNPVRYRMKKNRDCERIGFIAEDVPDILASDDRKGLSPMGIVSVLVKVIQDLQKFISLERRIT